MAEILFRLKDNFHSDPEKDRRGCYKKGYPVSIKPDGWYEGNPHWSQSAYADKSAWAVIRCPEVTVEQAQKYAQAWKDDFDYEIVSANLANGQYVVRVLEKNVSASGINALVLPKVNAFLSKWGCSAITATANCVQFTFSLWSAVRSKAFWDDPLIETRGTFILNSYTAGIGNITFTAIPTAFVDMDEEKITKQIIRNITMQGGTVTTQAYPAFTFEIER